MTSAGLGAISSSTGLHLITHWLLDAPEPRPARSRSCMRVLQVPSEELHGQAPPPPPRAHSLCRHPAAHPGLGPAGYQPSAKAGQPCPAGGQHTGRSQPLAGMAEPHMCAHTHTDAWCSEPNTAKFRRKQNKGDRN